MTIFFRCQTCRNNPQKTPADVLRYKASAKIEAGRPMESLARLFCDRGPSNDAQIHPWDLPEHSPSVMIYRKPLVTLGSRPKSQKLTNNLQQLSSVLCFFHLDLENMSWN